MIRLSTNGVADKAARFFQNNQLTDRALWAKFVDLFRTRDDSQNGGWRGEYWGKMMRGGCLVYEYTRDGELYDVLTKSVEDMLTTAEADGRVSSYERHNQFTAWDMWCRKYVILACQYYLDICTDDALRGRITDFIKGCADSVLAHVGKGEGKININETSIFWYGLNSSSILEPMVRLYRLTGEQKYLDFATYIVDEGGTSKVNVFKLAYENKLAPYEYGVSKAYEMISCFEGLLEYYYATGAEWCKSAVVNFAHAVADTDLSIIGCSGVTNELFDFTSARQTVRQNDVLQETCVTVTWMKFCSRVLELTADARFADCMEQSFYNAYLGAINDGGRHCPSPEERFVAKMGITDFKPTLLPVDSYSPLLSSKRGLEVGGLQLLADHSYYGCCACISAAGVGVFMKNMVTVDENGVTVNFFEKGCAELEYKGVKLQIIQKTDYPVDGKVEITVNAHSPITFDLRVRIPGWTGKKDGFAVYSRQWSNQTVCLNFDMPICTLLPQKWDKATVYNDMSTADDHCYAASAAEVYHRPEDDNYIALMRGPLVLAADSRLGKAAGEVFDFEPVGELCEDKMVTDDEQCLVKMKFTDRKGENFYLIDYASAGKDWQSEIAAWLKTK